MIIVFNLQRVGLGNNGGSRTIIKCAETLQELGHNVTLWCSANNYKWSKIKVPVSKNMPKCDVIVATGYHSVPSTVSAKVPRKFYYIRGFELWQASESKLIRSYKSLNCIVNSEWLQKYLTSKGIKSNLVYPGVDFDVFGKDNDDREDTIGGIYSKKHSTKRHQDVIDIGKSLGYKVLLLNRDIVHPDSSSLREFYNKIKIWISPSELEGLHNCPFESALCGSFLVATDHPRGGISDYAIHNSTAMLYPARNLKKAKDCVEKYMNNDKYGFEVNKNLCKLLKVKIGDRVHNMNMMASVFRGQYEM